MRRIVTVEVCGRCPDEREKVAVQTISFSWNGTYYELAVCQQHADMFDRDMSPWRMLAEEVEPPTRLRSATFTGDLAERQRRAAELRARESKKIRQAASAANRFSHAKIRGAEMITALEAADAQQRHEHEATAMRQHERITREYEQRAFAAVPGAMQWHLTSHARTRMEERGYDIRDVLLTATAPGSTYKQPWRGPNVFVHERVFLRDGGVEDLCRIIVNKLDHVIITVIDRNAPFETAESYQAAHPRRAAVSR